MVCKIHKGRTVKMVRNTKIKKLFAFLNNKKYNLIHKNII